VVLTHYYARGATQLYVDSVREGNVAERLRPTGFDFGGAAAPTRVQLRNLYFYRSGMNQDEVWHGHRFAAERQPRNLCPPQRRLADSLNNFAQSTNTLSRVAGPLAVRESLHATQTSTSLYPNPTSGVIAVQGALGLEGAPVEVRDLLGRAVLRAKLRNGRVNLSTLPAGVYMLTLKADSETLHRRVERL
jgi:hypothetical protein